MDIRDRWIELSEGLGFQFKDAITAFSESPRLLQAMQENGAPKNTSLLQNPFFARIFNKLFLGIAAGVYRGHECFLMRVPKGGSKSSSRNYEVCIAQLFKRGFDLGMKIYKASPMTRIGMALFPAFYVRLPDKGVSRVVAVRGRKKAQIMARLSQAATLNALKELAPMVNSFKVTDEGIKCRVNGEIIGEGPAIAIMDKMTEFSSCFTY